MSAPGDAVAEVREERISPPDKPTWDYFDLASIVPAAARPGARALDIGCGPGSSRHLERKGYRSVGFDVTAGDAVQVVGDGHHLPFGDGAFELVTSMSVFEHLEDPWRACAEIARVLAPGGVLACSMSFLEPFHARSHFHFSHLGARRLLEGSGLAVELVEPLGFTYSEACLRQLLPLPLVPRLAGLATRLVLASRRLLIRALAETYRRRAPGKYRRALAYREEDRFRFEAGFKLVGRKP